MSQDNHHNKAMEPSQGVLTRSATLKAAAAAALLARLDIPLSIATCMAQSRFGEAVGCLVLVSRAFYSDAQLWGAFKEHQGPLGRTRLMYAARAGNVARARFLLDRGARMDVCTQWNVKRQNVKRQKSFGTALMCASRAGHLDVTRLLIERGANVSAARIGDGFTALMLASWKGHLEIAQLLVEGGANVNAARTDTGSTALMKASQYGHLGIVQLLVEEGANVNAARTDDGWTALMRAARDGNLEIVRLLLTRGADKAALNHAGNTALFLCAAHPAIRALLA